MREREKKKNFKSNLFQQKKERKKEIRKISLREEEELVSFIFSIELFSLSFSNSNRLVVVVVVVVKI